MSHMHTPYCTLCAQNGIRTDLAPNEGFRSKHWRYCVNCYKRRFPAAAKKKGLIKQLPPKPVKPMKKVKPVKPVQMALFELPKVQPLPPCDCTGAFDHK
jgi:hypothetical protein